MNRGNTALRRSTGTLGWRGGAIAPSCYRGGEGKKVKLIVVGEVKLIIEKRHCNISIL
jgi:hypothetical protein